jgi:NADH-quinone oxidoreductase subunit N
MSYLPILKLAAPELIVVITAFAVLAADLVALRGLELRYRLLIGAMISCLGCVISAGWLLALPEQGNLSEGMLVANPLIQVVQLGLLVLTVFTLLLSVESRFTEHAGEYFALVLLAAVGMMFLVAAEDVLMIFVSLELTSLSLYILAAFNKQSPESAEAALKYFVFGAVSAAFTLFGLSLLYGFSGATSLNRIAAAIHGPTLDPLLILAMVMTAAGFAFKVAAAPFHLWAPDVYQGAPTPSAAFIASGSKVAGFVVLAKVMMFGLKGGEGSAALQIWQSGWVPLLAIVAAISMLLGNLAALVQTSVRRLLAYSAVAHAGYVLVAVVAHSGVSLAALIYYVLTYALTALGAFGVVSIVQDQTGGDRMADFAGLSRRAPLLSACMMVFMLSLAGIPPLAGFFGKFYVFSAALSTGNPPLQLLWLVILAIGLSVVSLYYYLQVLKQIYVAEAEAARKELSWPAMRQAAVVLLAMAVVALGCAPGWLTDLLAAAIRVAGP